MPWISRDEWEDTQDRLRHLEETQQLLLRRFPDVLKPYETQSLWGPKVDLSLHRLRKEVADLETFEAAERGRQLTNNQEGAN